MFPPSSSTATNTKTRQQTNGPPTDVDFLNEKIESRPTSPSNSDSSVNELTGLQNSIDSDSDSDSLAQDQQDYIIN